jgi:Zinc finger, C3HC4 type (RING finger)/Inhibitor of Apoptosis domain
MESFIYWPRKDDYTLSALKKLVRRGFYYTGTDDCIRCAGCGIEFKNLSNALLVDDVHKRINKCDFVKIIENDNDENYDNENDVVVNDCEQTLSSTDVNNVTNFVFCNICMENELNVCLIPCGHVLCYQCSCKVDKCPYCNNSFNVQRLYL